MPLNNNNGKITLDSLLKIAQLAVFPVLAGMIWLLLEIFSVKANQLAIAARLDNLPKIVDRVEEMGKTIAVIQDRQNSVIRRVDNLEEDMSHHRERSTYDPIRPKK